MSSYMESMQQKLDMSQDAPEYLEKTSAAKNIQFLIKFTCFDNFILKMFTLFKYNFVSKNCLFHLKLFLNKNDNIL